VLAGKAIELVEEKVSAAARWPWNGC